MLAFLSPSLITVEEIIESHPAWIGHVSGWKAEMVLRNKKVPYLYLLRGGETEGDYYVSFVSPDLTIKHTPFIISITQGGWYCQNGHVSGPFINKTIDHVIHSIMHCDSDECVPFIDAKKVYDSVEETCI